MNPTQTVQTPVRHDVSLLSEQDLYLFNEGSNYRIYEKMGGRLTKAGGVEGTCFSVWAPSAQRFMCSAALMDGTGSRIRFNREEVREYGKASLRVSAKARFISFSLCLITTDTGPRKQIRWG